jgi:hypothetical protein
MQYKNIISIQGNELFSAGAYRTVGGVNKYMTEIVSENILSDYKNGIVSATQEMVGCLDLQNEAGATVKAIEDGGLLHIGDIVRVDSDDSGTPILQRSDGEARIFRVKGRKFSYDGRPMLSLVYQEIRR